MGRGWRSAGRHLSRAPPAPGGRPGGGHAMARAQSSPAGPGPRKLPAWLPQTPAARTAGAGGRDGTTMHDAGAVGALAGHCLGHSVAAACAAALQTRPGGLSIACIPPLRNLASPAPSQRASLPLPAALSPLLLLACSKQAAMAAVEREDSLEEVSTRRADELNQRELCRRRSPLAAAPLAARSAARSAAGREAADAGGG